MLQFCNVSLNNKLIRVPDLMNSFIGVSIRFRKKQSVLVAGVEHIFDKVKSECKARKWLEWLSCLPAISDLRISRCVKPEGFGFASTFEIHNFSVASSYAHGACSYLRIVYARKQSVCSFMIGKARLAPIKTVSTPRLDLIAIVLVVTLNNMVVCELDAESCVSYFWTDFMRYCTAEKNKS